MRSNLRDLRFAFFGTERGSNNGQMRSDATKRNRKGSENAAFTGNASTSPGAGKTSPRLGPVALPHSTSPPAMSRAMGALAARYEDSQSEETPEWGSIHKRDLIVQIFDKNTTLYEHDCPHLRGLPTVPVRPRFLAMNPENQDLTKCKCETCENK